MNLWIIAILVVAAGSGIWAARSQPTSHRAVLVVVQLASTALMLLALYPPAMLQSTRRVTVLTPGVTSQQIAALRGNEPVIVLPGVEMGAIAKSIRLEYPDLASALRAHPGYDELRIVGGGLPARDRDAARGRVAAFDAAPLPQGLVELEAEPSVAPGEVWRLRGRVGVLDKTHLRLRDPGDTVTAETDADRGGAFALQTIAKANNRGVYQLEVVDAGGALLQSVPVALAVQARSPRRVLILAGGLDAELKYLRRWIVDSGAQLDARTTLAPAVGLRDGKVDLSDVGLQAVDLAMVDERAWAALGAAQKQSLLDALRDGMGLLLRATGPLPDAVRTDWAELGLSVNNADVSSTTHLLDTAVDNSPALTRLALQFDGDSQSVLPLLRSSDGKHPALWRAYGRGRIGLTWLLDSYRWTLAGDRASYSGLWATIVSRLARATGGESPKTPQRSWVDLRGVLCGLADTARVIDSNGERTELLPDIQRCAAYWPSAAGWHHLESGSASKDFYVLDHNAAPGLLAVERADATRRLLQDPPAIVAAAMPTPRWPWLLAWLIVTGLLWWLERRKSPGLASSAALKTANAGENATAPSLPEG